MRHEKVLQIINLFRRKKRIVNNPFERGFDVGTIYDETHF